MAFDPALILGLVDRLLAARGDPRRMLEDAAAALKSLAQHNQEQDEEIASLLKQVQDIRKQLKDMDRRLRARNR